MVCKLLLLYLYFFTVQAICCEASLSYFLSRALKQALHEQYVEDENSAHKIDNHLVRRLIVMPLTDEFNPSQLSQMYSKVQHGDKCSLPGSIGRVIFEKPYEVPWIFEITPVKYSSTKNSGSLSSTPSRSSADPYATIIERAYVSPLDFRAPENYIFVPRWLMKHLNLNPNDVVDVSFVRLKSAALVVLQPLTPTWDKLVTATKDPKAILEQEINKYSSLTSGADISIEVDKKEFTFRVKEVLAEGNIAVHGVRIQDSDVNFNIDRSVLDKLIQHEKEKAL